MGNQNKSLVPERCISNDIREMWKKYIGTLMGSEIARIHTIGEMFSMYRKAIYHLDLGIDLS